MRLLEKYDDFHEVVKMWIASETEPHDVSVCDCCGNMDYWYGEPGRHNHFSGPDAREPFPGCY